METSIDVLILSNFQRSDLKEEFLKGSTNQTQLHIIIYFLLVISEHTDFETEVQIKNSNLLMQCWI